MAQPDDSRRTPTPDALKSQNSPSSRSSRTQISPNRPHLLQGDASSWSPNSSPKLRTNHDHGNPNHHHKKSVLMKVKEKARKLKRTLSGRKRREENASRSPYSTPPAGISGLADDEKEESEYFGSPLHEFEGAPGTQKPAAKEHPQEAKHHGGAAKKMEEPPSTMVALRSNQATSSGSTNTTETADTFPKDVDFKAKNEARDKGISVKEYLMQKLEPGEDERALSQVITQKMSLREAMSSFLRTEESTSSTSKTSNPKHDNQNLTPAASSSVEPRGLGSGLSNASSGSNHVLESSLSNASNLSLMSSSTAASWQNQKPNPSSRVRASSPEDIKDENRRRALQAN